MNLDIYEAHERLDKWFKGDVVGNLTFFRAPKSDLIGCVVDQVIKVYEMDIDQAKALAGIVKQFGNVNGEFRVNSEGQPDRIKIRREF